MMRSAARLTYRGLQDAHDGRGDRGTGLKAVAPATIDALYGAYDALRAAREDRGAIDLELPERRLVMGDSGEVTGVEKRPRYDSHRIVEEFMIAANVCAAETLEAARLPCMYRVHGDPPAVRPRHFAQLLRTVSGTGEAPMVNMAILRAQSQALYTPDNSGHFGLALRNYAHFTSPIRRYSDLAVHRSLITALDSGTGGEAKHTGKTGPDRAAFAALGEHLSMTERRATDAERATVDRLTAAFISPQIGAEFEATITGVERFGLFVALDDSGAEGLLPVSALGKEMFHHDPARRALSARKSGEIFRLGDEIRVTLEETEPLTGGLIFGLAGRAKRPHGTRRGETRRKAPGARRRKGGRR
jgi:ribonuclease R